MTYLLSKIFIKSPENVKDPAVRRAYGTMVSIVGILANLLLAAIKFFAGMISGAISITADAVNNVSDAGSQIISLISFKISAKPADRDHPFGHARIEYVASMIVSFLILHVGLDLFTESVNKILHPSPTEFSIPVFIILGVSVAGKLWLFIFNRTVAKKINSSVMKATAADSLSDAASTAAVLIAALIGYFTNIQTDAYMGIIVAVLILVAGIKILNETKNSILGSPPEQEVVDAVASLALSYPEILGIHDMVIHNYGAGNTIASLHAEVDGAANIFDTHDVIDNLEKRLFLELGVRATVHMDPIVTDDEKVTALREITLKTVLSIDERLNIHDFRYVEGTTHSNLIFDVVAPFELKMSDEELKREISSRISRVDPTYFVVITVDRE
ncbi:MAG: cation transporter [Ruminococcaceae bacterium]|nr:cation transporter [Oscillospiraceae bacterium]